MQCNSALADKTFVLIQPLSLSLSLTYIIQRSVLINSYLEVLLLWRLFALITVSKLGYCPKDYKSLPVGHVGCVGFLMAKNNLHRNAMTLWWL